MSQENQGHWREVPDMRENPTDPEYWEDFGSVELSDGDVIIYDENDPEATFIQGEGYKRDTML